MRKFEKLYESIKQSLGESMSNRVVIDYIEKIDNVFREYESKGQDPIIVLDTKHNTNNNTYEVVYTIGSKKNNLTQMDKFDKRLIVLKVKKLLQDLEDIDRRIKVIPETHHLKKRGMNGIYPAFKIEIGD